jgi:hypothetical protein
MNEFCGNYRMTTAASANGNGVHKKPHPPLNERTISSLGRRSVAAHPWHDLEIGQYIVILPFSLLQVFLFFSY